jgi:hypothetical protein
MLSLREQQAGFAAALFNPAASRAAPGIRADGISPAVRLGFYRTNVFENYRKALAATYPAVEKLVGHGFFANLAEEYIRRYPSHWGDVGRHGEQFAEFLRRHACAHELLIFRTSRASSGASTRASTKRSTRRLRWNGLPMFPQDSMSGCASCSPRPAA